LKRYPQAIEYLKQRGLTGVVAKRFGLGFAPPGYQGLSDGFSDYESTPDFIECGLVVESDSEPKATGKNPGAMTASAIASPFPSAISVATSLGLVGESLVLVSPSI
jgi:hypothetical protein